MAEWLRVVKSADFIQAFNHFNAVSGVGSSPTRVHVRQAKILRVCQVVLLGVLTFLPHLLIGPSHMR